MKAISTKAFKKIYSKRILRNKKLDQRFGERYMLFVKDSSNPALRDHALSGKLKGYRAFSITGDVRVIYYIHKNRAYFVDVGTHSQVYEE